MLSWGPSPSLPQLSRMMSVGAMAYLSPPTPSKSWDVSKSSRPSLTPDSASMWTSPEESMVWLSVLPYCKGFVSYFASYYSPPSHISSHYSVFEQNISGP